MCATDNIKNRKIRNQKELVKTSIRKWYDRMEKICRGRLTQRICGINIDEYRGKAIPKRR